MTIAGLDPSGGAGVLADVRAFDAAGVYGTGVVATVTFQSSHGVEGRFDLPPGAVRSQVETLVSDRSPDAVKTGALGSAETVEEVGELIREYRLGPLVVDPVFRSTSGAPLIDESGLDLFKSRLLTLASIVTPNVEEASLLCGFEIFDIDDARVAALRLHEMGALTVVVTGLRVEGETADLFFDGEGYDVYSGPWLEAEAVHGTGCLFSASIAALLARGCDLESSLQLSREVVRRGIEEAVRTGGGQAFANPNATLRLEAADSPGISGFAKRARRKNEGRPD